MISVIIPTYKNRDILLANLNYNLPFLEDCEVIIVNDNPEESLKEDLKKFKSVVLLENKKNLGFGESVNQGVKKARGELVILLNDDVQLQNDSFNKAQEYFKKNKLLFAVSFAQKEKDGSIVGKNKIYWKNGLFLHSRADNLTYGFNGWAEGGACLIDKKKFTVLGGFDNLYSPFYWEDIDLSYRAWKQNFQILFNPQIVVTHHHQSTISKLFTKDKIQQIAYRNQLIFIWKNINDKKMLGQHFLFLIPNLLRGGAAFIKGLFQAISVFLLILKRKKNQPDKLSDSEVLSKFL